MTNRQLFKPSIVSPFPTQTAFHAFNTSFSAFILRGRAVLFLLLFFLAISDTPIIGQCATSPVTANNGLHFDGANDCVAINSCSNGVIFPGGNALTIEYWFKGTNMQSAVRMQTVSGDFIVAGWQNTKHILSNSSGTLGGVAVGTGATDGNWHHVAVTWYQGVKFTSYLDGVLVEQTAAASRPLPSFNTGVYLGALDGTSAFMNGTLDEVRVWTVARTQAQIQADQYACSPSDQTGLLLFYKFNHGAVNSANTGITGLLNSASNDFHGVLTNFNLATTTNWVTGFPIDKGVNIVTSPTLSGSQCVGNTPTLTTKATTNGLTTILWQYKAVGASNYADVELSAYTSNTNATYTIPSLSVSDNGAMYRAVFRGTCGNVVTDVASNAVTIGVAPVTTRVYVKANATGNNKGQDWANAFTDLQSALNYPCTATLTEIWVAKGTYKPTTTTTDRSAAFAMKAGVEIYGSFKGTETLLSERTPSVRAANLSILSGDIDEATDPLVVSGSGSTLSISGNNGNSYSVVLNDGNALTNAAVLDGFTISGAFRSGMYNNYSSPSVRNVTFAFNHADEGGGMYNFAATPSLFNVVFMNNTGGYGGGMHNKSSDVTLNNVVFVGNYAFFGGGIYGNAANTAISSTTFVNNYAMSGGGVYIRSGNVFIGNSIFWGNRRTDGATVSNTEGPVLVKQITYSDVESGYAGTGNINQDPLFVNIANPIGADGLFGTTDDGLALTACSPAVNAGSSPNVGTDIVSNPRIFEGTVDMGAYELQTTSLLPDIPTTTTNNALNFDGVNDYVQITNCSNTALTNTDALTIEYWFKGASNHSAVRLQPDNSNFIIAGYFSGATGVHLVRLNNTPYSVAMGNTTDGNWHHVAMTWQRNTTNGFKSYLDGALVAQTNTPNVALPVVTSGMWLGSSGTPPYTSGSLDEVRVWGVVRTQAEIQNNRLGCTNLAGATGLVLYYQFNHGAADGNNSSITTLANSANANTFPAILRNFTNTGSTSNWTASPLCTDAYTWTGGNSTDWTNGSNWSPTIVPTNTSSLTIPTTTNKLTLTANQTANIVTLSGTGKIILGNYNLTTNNLNGGSSTAYVVTNGTGSLTLKDIGTTTTLFPVGPSETIYAPATITNNVNRDFTVKVGTAITNAAALTKTVNLQWEVTPSVSTGNLATLALNWPSASQNSSFTPNATVEVAHYNGSAWDRFYLATVAGTNPYTATVTGVNAFSPFVVANQNALPIELLDFKGTPQYNGNFLTWTTANEVNNKGFQVERAPQPSQGAFMTWEVLGFIDAKGKAATYDFLDRSSLWGLGAYRLRQMDNDGKETLSKVIIIERRNAMNRVSIKVYPNPAHNNLAIDYNVDGQKGTLYTVVNTLGEILLQGKLTSRDLDISSLPTGVFVIKVGEGQSKFFKQ